MQNLFISLIFPHYCCACGKIGALLCDRCRYDIVSDGYGACVICRLPVQSSEALCKSCRAPYSRAWCVAAHEGAVRRLVSDLKFERVKAAGQVLGSLLASSTPELPPDVTVVPVPTVAQHIRQRGYDHCALIARAFAKEKGLNYAETLSRQTSTTQRGAGRRDRLSQAKLAFEVDRAISGVVVLVDDVFTTGATLHYAAEKAREAGASDVWIAIISREPLD